jgi:hypothetical protein
MGWSTVSKALRKSKNTSSVYSPKFYLFLK